MNHHNVATLHGFEQDRETSFLVMELVEGETLAERIARGAMSVEEAVLIFLQIADADAQRSAARSWARLAT